MGRSRSLAGRTAIVTGGTRGVGRSLVRALVQRGARVALCARNTEEVDATTRELGAALGRALDVSDRAAVTAFMNEVEGELGPIDIVVNVAGIMLIGPFENEEDTTTQRTLEVNLLAPIFCMKDAARRMKARGSGHIVNVASAASWIAGGGGATYCASKFGLLGYSECVALELHGTNVDISVVAPGVIETDMTAGVTEIRGVRNVTPDEVAATIIGVLERPRFVAFVPRRVGVMARTFSALPVSLRQRLARLSNTSTLMLQADMAARRSYEERARGPGPTREVSADRQKIHGSSARNPGR